MNKHQNYFDVKSIINQFEISGDFCRAESISVGHINDTFLIKTKDDNDPDYVIQRINHNIFKDVDKLMDNIYRVTTHITNKLTTLKETHHNRYLELVKSKNQELYYHDKFGNYWRCYVYCPNKTVDFNVITPAMAFEGGVVLGKFQAFLSDLPGGRLHDIIPDFHNLEKRLSDFNMAIKNNLLKRVKIAKAEIDFFNYRAMEMLKVNEIGKQGLLPVRVTHNDTKFNNILFDENANALCIIDLDTVMNGYVLFDFGDAIRTLANTAAEDETNLSRVKFNFELYDCFSKGYLKETLPILTKTEIEYLAFSAKLMTYIIALRFLTDFLNGDVYFKINYKTHNLNRARNQLELLKQMDKNFGRMSEIIGKYS